MHVSFLCPSLFLLLLCINFDNSEPSSSDDDSVEHELRRAFERAINSLLHVSGGKEVLELLRQSKKIRNHLQQLRQFLDLDIRDVQFHLRVTKWNSLIAQFPGMKFRGFVYGVISLLRCIHCTHVVYTCCLHSGVISGRDLMGHFWL